MKETGKMIKDMGEALKSFKMAMFIKEIMLMGKLMVKEFFNGLMEKSMTVNGVKV